MDPILFSYGHTLSCFPLPTDDSSSCGSEILSSRKGRGHITMNYFLFDGTLNHTFLTWRVFNIIIHIYTHDIPLQDEPSPGSKLVDLQRKWPLSKIYNATNLGEDAKVIHLLLEDPVCPQFHIIIHPEKIANRFQCTHCLLVFKSRQNAHSHKVLCLKKKDKKPGPQYPIRDNFWLDHPRFVCHHLAQCINVQFVIIILRGYPCWKDISTMVLVCILHGRTFWISFMTRP